MNRAFSSEMNGDGYVDITNIDFSEIVINDMERKYASLEGLKCTSFLSSLLYCLLNYFRENHGRFGNDI